MFISLGSVNMAAHIITGLTVGLGRGFKSHQVHFYYSGELRYQIWLVLGSCMTNISNSPASDILPD
jgi:hypothetical protein